LLLFMMTKIWIFEKLDLEKQVQLEDTIE